MSSRFGYWNPYRSPRKGYIVHKKPDSPSYRSLTMMELKQLKKHYNLGPFQSQIPSPILRNHIYRYISFQPDPFTYPDRIHAVEISGLTPVPHPTGQTNVNLVIVPSVVAGQASYRYLHTMLVSPQGYVSFYCFILHRVTISSDLQKFGVRYVGVRPEDRIYYLGASDPISRASGDPFTEQNYPSIGLHSDNPEVGIFYAGYQTIFHVYPDDGASPTLINIAFTGDSPKYPYALLPTRLFIGLNAPTPASAAE